MRRIIPSIKGVRLSVLVAASSFGQGSTTGTFSGTVKDPSGATVTGAKVALRNQGTGFERVPTTNDEGGFVFTQVVPVNYSLSVKAPSFKIVKVSKQSRLTIALEVGMICETVNVTATQEVINTRDKILKTSPIRAMTTPI